MILYYTHNAKPREFMERCYHFHRDQADRVGQQFRAVVSEQFMDDDEVYEFDPQWPKYADIYLRILRGLTCIPDGDPVFLAEDDTLYPDERYLWTMPDLQTVIYNLNLCYIGPKGYAWHHENGIALSQLMGTASAVRYNVGLKLQEVLDGCMSCVEPVSGEGTEYRSTTCRLPVPSVDFRTDYNATWRLPDDLSFFEDLHGWPTARDLWKNIYEGSE
jgi:hypothetical protein